MHQTVFENYKDLKDFIIDEQYDGYDETRIRMPSQMRRNEGLDNFLAASRFMKTW